MAPKKTSEIVKWVTKWWKSVIYMIGVFASLIMIATPAYILNEKLNTFVAKNEVADVVRINDLKPVYEKLNIIDERLDTQDSKLDTVNENVLKIYTQLLNLKGIK